MEDCDGATASVSLMILKTTARCKCKWEKSERTHVRCHAVKSEFRYLDSYEIILR
jgi:hypothetical protein